MPVRFTRSVHAASCACGQAGDLPLSPGLVGKRLRPTFAGQVVRSDDSNQVEPPLRINDFHERKELP
jgi:hypothetical protein